MAFELATPARFGFAVARDLAPRSRSAPRRRSNWHLKPTSEPHGLSIYPVEPFGRSNWLLEFARKPLAPKQWVIREVLAAQGHGRDVRLFLALDMSSRSSLPFVRVLSALLLLGSALLRACYVWIRISMVI